MKKNYALLTGLVFVASLGFSQSLNKFKNEEAKLKLTEEIVSTNSIGVSKIRKNQSKIPGTVLFSETFANQVPAGWTISNNAGNSNNWIWSNSAPGGQYSSTISAMNSTTGANGYMSLPSDLYNTPFPVGGPIAMDTWFTSPAISIPATASVELKFEQSQRYCCVSTDSLVVSVSNDGTNWTTIDATLGRSPSTAVPSPSSAPAEVVVMNVSSVLSGQTTAYIRFRQTGATHYYWMIDDVELREGSANAMEIVDWSINFSDTSINPVLSMVPYLALDPMTFDVETINAGSNTQTNVNFVVDIIHDSMWTVQGGGTGVRATMITPYGIPVPSLQMEVIGAGTYVNTIDGYFRAVFSITSDSVNQNPAKATTTQRFIVTDTIMSKDLGPYLGDAGPSNYVGGGNDGDRWGSLMSIGTNPRAGGSIVCNSISILVANVSTNDGASISPRIWFWNDTAATIANAITSPPAGSSPFSTTIDTSMLGRWVVLPIFPPASIIPGSQYVVGWEQTGGASNGAEFTAARDRNLELRQPDISNFVFVNDASPSWGWVTQLAAIRLNLDLDFTIGLSEVNSLYSFSVFPNPNNGNFKLAINTLTSTTFILKVRNMLGQIVFTENVSVNGQKSLDLALSGAEKGLYIVSLENGAERQVQKVILK